MSMSSLPLLAPSSAYLVSGALYAWRVLRRDRRAGSIGFVVGCAGAALHGALLLARLVVDPHSVCATVSDAASLVSFLTAVVFLVVQRPFGIDAIGFVVMPVCFGGALFAATVPSAARAIPDVLRSPWFFAHVPPALLSYVAFAFAFGAAAMYLGESSLLRSKRVAAVVGVLPPLGQLEHAMYRTAAFGFLLLTVAMATGAAWAQDAWGEYWSWSPKQTASLVTWLVFAAYLHYRVVRGSRGRNGARLIVVGFVCVVLTFLAVGALEQDQLHRFF